MKHLLIPACVALLGTTPLLANSPKLILHFDVNGTIMAADSAGNKRPEETLIQELAERVYGSWEGSETTSYADYLRKRYPGESNKQIRRHHLNRLLEVMEADNHPQLEEIKGKLDSLMAKISEGTVFPSFYRLLTHLEDHQIPYTVHLRTFGGDTRVVSQDVEDKLGHPLFTTRLWAQQEAFADGSGKTVSIEGAYQIFCEENVAGQEDWSHWLTHHKQVGTGKTFPIDVNDMGTISIFFDDHIEGADSPTNIVVPVDLEGNTLDLRFLLESGELCPVNTLEAIEDPDYFIKKVEKAIKFARDRTRTYTPYGTRT